MSNDSEIFVNGSAWLSFNERLLVVCLSLVWSCPDSVVGSQFAKSSFVRKVDFSCDPHLKSLAEHARRTGNEMYPQVCALLVDKKADFPKRFDILFKTKLPNGDSGETIMTEIRLDVSYLNGREDDLAYFDHVLIHEMAHVAQHYNRPIIGRFVVYTPHPPRFWTEGIADYVYFKLSQADAQPCAECALRFAHYRSGYSCAAALLLYLEKTYDPNIVRQLNSLLRRGKYSDDFFLKTTGKGLPELWAEFQLTSAFTPNAARMLKLQQSLGYRDGMAPPDLDLRFEAFINQPAYARTKELLRICGLPSVENGDPSSSMVAFLYFMQPGGTAETCLMKLQENNLLPGIADARETLLSGPLRLSGMDPVFPCARTFTVQTQGDASTYHYTVFCPAAEAGWTLQRAWRTAPDGLMAEEYPIP